MEADGGHPQTGCSDVRSSSMVNSRLVSGALSSAPKIDRTATETTLRHKMPKSDFHLFRYFQFVSVAAICVILIVAGLGLRFIFRGMVLFEAEKDAIGISSALRDSEMSRFIQATGGKEKQLSISGEDLLELDRHMRIFLAPFNIVKIKVFNSDTLIIYSTDSKIIGRTDPDNIKLAKALAGSPISSYETKDSVWDLADEERKNVKIVETYVPIKSPAGRIVGSFEIYENVTHDLAMADRILVRAWTILAVVVLSVFSALMIVIRRAARAVESGTEDLKATNILLLQEIEERKRLEEELLSIIEKERQRIGQELHDTIGQQLTGISMMTGVLNQKLSAKSIAEASYAREIAGLIDQAHEQAHDLAKGLNPINLAESSLISALTELAETTEHLFGIACRLKHDGSINTNDELLVTHLYRISQEAITNAIKHGKAKTVNIELSSNTDNSTLIIRNDGLDFPEAEQRGKSMGLKIMKYRAEMIGGSLVISKAAGGGTIVTCEFSNGDMKSETGKKYDQ